MPFICCQVVFSLTKSALKNPKSFVQLQPECLGVSLLRERSPGKTAKDFPTEVTKDSLKGKMLFSKRKSKLGQKTAETVTGACLNSLGFPIPSGNAHFGVANREFCPFI